MATRIQFRCASCSYLVKVPIAYAGRKGKCPGCKEVVRIPNEPAAESPKEKPDKAARVTGRSEKDKTEKDKAELLAAKERAARAETTRAKRPGPKIGGKPTDDSRSEMHETSKLDASKLDRPSERKAKPKLAPPVGLPGAELVVPAMPRSEAPTRRMPRLEDPAPAAGARPVKTSAPARDDDDAPMPAGASHLFRRVGSEPIRLQVGVPVVIGRSQDCDLTIPSSRVSRRHAQVVWKGARPYLEDLGSQNGTLVNGAPVQSHRLRDGDEILVGPFLIGYAIARAGEEPDALDFMADSDLKTEFTLVDAMSGRLEEVTLFEVLQTLEFNKKTGTLEVSSSAGTARIGVDKGFVVFARLGDTRGADAVLGAFEWDKGRFRLEPALTSTADLRLPITGLLLEAGRRLDERG